MIERGGDEPLCFSDAILRRHYGARAYGRRRHLIKEIELAVAEGVVDEGAVSLQRPARLGGQVEDRHMFGVGAADAAQRIEFAGARGRVDRRQPLDPGVTVGRIGRVDLVARADVLHVLVGANRVVDRKGVVAGNAEHVGHPELAQTGQHILNGGLWLLWHLGSPCLSHCTQALGQVPHNRWSCAEYSTVIPNVGSRKFDLTQIFGVALYLRKASGC